MVSPTTAQRHKLNRDPITDAHIILLEFQEVGSSTVHRAAINNEDITHNSNTYIATDITFSLPSSGTQYPTIRLEMSNITRVIGQILVKARNRIECTVKLIDASDPDTAIIDTKNMFVLADVSGDSRRVSGQLRTRASQQEPVPNRRTFKWSFPGVWFRP